MSGIAAESREKAREKIILKPFYAGINFAGRDDIPTCLNLYEFLIKDFDWEGASCN
jgi:hypothetical protein